MCGQWGDKGTFKSLESDVVKGELSIEEIKALLEDLKTFKPNITLFGGEPMLYRNWVEVVNSKRTVAPQVKFVPGALPELITRLSPLGCV